MYTEGIKAHQKDKERDFLMKKMYNILFPIFLLFLYPMTWIGILPINFIIDLLVFDISMRHLKIENRKKLLFPAMWKIWSFGFLSDLIGCTVLVVFVQIATFIPSLYDVVSGIAWNPYSNIVSFLLTVLSILTAGYLIYIFNKKYALKKTGMDEIQKHRTALYLAVFTSPYVLLIPTMWLY